MHPVQIYVQILSTILKFKLVESNKFLDIK